MESIVWLWIAAGVLMILAELLVPGFVILFFGVSALLVGLLRACFDFPLPLQLLLFAVSGVLFLLLCRKCFPKIFHGTFKEEPADIDGDSVAGSPAVVAEPIEPPLPGRIDFRGSLWEAVCDHPVPAGRVVRVVRRDNLTLTVEETGRKNLSDSGK